MSRISSAESLVMQALWARGALPADEIMAEVAGPQGWGEATVRTLGGSPDGVDSVFFDVPRHNWATGGRLWSDPQQQQQQQQQQ